MEIKKYAAIDIGSNAIRLLIQHVLLFPNKNPKFKKSSITRVPIRLGKDTFIKGFISQENIERMTQAMEAFKLLMNIHGVVDYKACATSAMRCASNGYFVVQQILEKTGVNIQIISGETEAKIIACSDLSSYIKKNMTYLYVDVGGGSTEFSLLDQGKVIVSKSFPLGTVRLLEKNDEVKETWKQAKKWTLKHCKPFNKMSLIGSGGNINKVFKMSGKALGEPLSKIYLEANYALLKQMSYNDRMIELDLNPDRADVIIPAVKIYVSAMRWSGSKDIYVPKIGLSDGIIKSFYHGGVF